LKKGKDSRILKYSEIKNKTQESFMNKYNNIFGQISRVISRIEFESIARAKGANKGIKGFSCWEQLMSMMFCQLSGSNSLREICNGLASSEGKLRHLGMKRPPKKSTLSYSKLPNNLLTISLLLIYLDF
jgi:hypothetical protein